MFYQNYYFFLYFLFLLMQFLNVSLKVLVHLLLYMLKIFFLNLQYDTKSFLVLFLIRVFLNGFLKCGIVSAECGMFKPIIIPNSLFRIPHFGTNKLCLFVPIMPNVCNVVVVVEHVKKLFHVLDSIFVCECNVVCGNLGLFCRNEGITCI